MQQSDLEYAMNRINRVHLACLPTPFERLYRMEQQLQKEKLFIKRDDLTGLGPGGNKLRSLEFLAGDAVAHGYDTLMAAGPVQSNLCTLTAAACAKLGLQCILVHNGTKPEREEGNVLLNRILGADAYYLGDVTAEERSRKAELLAEEKGAYLIKNGATTGIGALGYVNAVPELFSQMSAACGVTQNWKEEKPVIFVPGGNGGVASGLIFGNAMLGDPFKIIVISVEDTKEILRAHIRKVLGEMEGILSLKLPANIEKTYILDDDYRGDGWGINTKESEQAVIDFPRAEGILIENVYNSKVLVGMEDYIRKGKVKGNACYLHTGGFGSLFAQF